MVQLYVCMCVCSVGQLCHILCDPMDCSPPDSLISGISQARVLEWVAISSSRHLSDPGIEPASLASPALAGGFFTTVPPGKPKSTICQYKIKSKIKKNIKANKKGRIQKKKGRQKRWGQALESW